MQKVRPDRASYLYIQGASVYFEYYRCQAQEAKGTLLLLHGFLASSACFHQLVPYLHKDYHLISCDLPVFGRSSKAPGTAYSLYGYARLVVELAARLGHAHVTIVGHSMGGQVALHAAKAFPDQIDRLVLLASSGYLNRVKRTYRAISHLPFAAPAIYAAIRRQDVRAFLCEAVYDKRVVTKSMVNAYTLPLSDASIGKGLILLARQREGDLTSAALHTIAKPCLIINGREDPVIPVQTSVRLAKDLANSQLILLKRCGHLLPEEKPSLIAKHMKRFLRKT
ncbi:alpha/beta fold hydrolase [Shouchella clausii]|uniref:alpha/beta fold hydrolase n=1 Tax=Shouchella clausii TaxID=79880 RepID=UPI00270A8FE8|nr:alpha/beta hydrolase [Shouchella clausii]MDO7268040.1 alpha/beta hydrolase [Shouchella clausii]MDO7287920.1 alpha/beta hydrolase [Shouchella clausii]